MVSAAHLAKHTVGRVKHEERKWFVRVLFYSLRGEKYVFWAPIDTTMALTKLHRQPMAKPTPSGDLRVAGPYTIRLLELLNKKLPANPMPKCITFAKQVWCTGSAWSTLSENSQVQSQVWSIFRKTFHNKCTCIYGTHCARLLEGHVWSADRLPPTRPEHNLLANQIEQFSSRCRCPKRTFSTRPSAKSDNPARFLKDQHDFLHASHTFSNIKRFTWRILRNEKKNLKMQIPMSTQHSKASWEFFNGFFQCNFIRTHGMCSVWFMF